MSDHADIVREWIGGCLALHGFREDCPACVAYRDANAALDALVAERDALLADSIADRLGFDARLGAAEAERDLLQAFKDEALQTDWISRAEALTQKLAHANALLQGVVQADKDDMLMGHPNPGDSCIAIYIGLTLMEYLDGIEP